MSTALFEQHQWPEILLTSSDKNAKKIHDKDWSHTSIGPIESWPQSLITTITTAMGSQFPVMMLWGSEFLVFFNEGYAGVLGEKQDWALGRPLKETWPEIWEPIHEMLKEVMRTGKGSWSEDQFYYLHRYGYPEEGYYTFSFARVIDEKGGFGGFSCVTIETTEKVIGQRRLKTLQEIATRAGSKSSLEEVYAESLAVLSENPRDISFAVLRMLPLEGSFAKLCGSFGVEALSRHLDPGATDSHPALKKVFETGVAELVNYLPSDLKQFPSQIGQKPAASALILP